MADIQRARHLRKTKPGRKNSFGAGCATAVSAITNSAANILKAFTISISFAKRHGRPSNWMGSGTVILTGNVTMPNAKRS